MKVKKLPYIEPKIGFQDSRTLHSRKAKVAWHRMRRNRIEGFVQSSKQRMVDRLVRELGEEDGEKSQ